MNKQNGNKLFVSKYENNRKILSKLLIPIWFRLNLSQILTVRSISEHRTEARKWIPTTSLFLC